MSQFKRFKPKILYERSFLTHSFWDWRERRWCIVFPARKIIIILTLESDYPAGCFGAPKYYCCYYTNDENSEKKLISCGRSLSELEDNIRRYTENEAYAKNLLGFVFHTLLEYKARTQIPFSEEYHVRLMENGGDAVSEFFFLYFFIREFYK